MLTPISRSPEDQINRNPLACRRGPEISHSPEEHKMNRDQLACRKGPDKQGHARLQKSDQTNRDALACRRGATKRMLFRPVNEELMKNSSAILESARDTKTTPQ